MPKVGKVTANFTGETEFFELWYDSRLMFHIKGLPQNFLEIVKDTFIARSFETEDKIRTALIYAVRDWKEATKDQKKVIAYKITASADLCMNKMEGHRGGFSGRREGISKRIKNADIGSEHNQLAITYVIMMAVTKGKTEYHPIYEDGTLGNAYTCTSDYSMIEWTAEREMFFNNISDQMYRMLVRMSTFFNDDDADVVKRIDQSKDSFLLTNGK